MLTPNYEILRRRPDDLCCGKHYSAAKPSSMYNMLDGEAFTPLSNKTAKHAREFIPSDVNDGGGPLSRGRRYVIIADFVPLRARSSAGDLT